MDDSEVVGRGYGRRSPSTDSGSDGGLKLSVNPRTGKQDIRLSIAYHGSPHVFDTFLTDHIGSGEGAQVHGWGLYFAKNMDVAEGYRERLADYDSGEDASAAIDTFIDEKSDPLGGEVDIGDLALVYDLISQGSLPEDFDFEGDVGTKTRSEIMDALGNPSAKEARLMNQVFSFIDSEYDGDSSVSKVLRYAQSYGPDVYSFFKDVIFELEENPTRPGRTFKVEVPDDDVMIREDDKFDRQPEVVKRAAEKILGKREGLAKFWEKMESFGIGVSLLSLEARRYADSYRMEAETTGRRYGQSALLHGRRMDAIK